MKYLLNIGRKIEWSELQKLASKNYEDGFVVTYDFDENVYIGEYSKVCDYDALYERLEALFGKEYDLRKV